MNILNYGAGAVGLGIDSCLLKTGHKVDILARPQTVSALQSNGLYRTGIFGDFHAPSNNFSCYTSLNQLPKKIYDFILVSTKSYDSKKAAQDLAHYPFLINDKTKIILFQNGWGNAETFASHFPQGQIFNARVITGFIRPEPHKVEITVHADSVHIGNLFSDDLKDIEGLCHAINQGGLPCETTSEIGKDLWAKMLYNCPLNALSAILGVTYGELAEHESTKELMNEIIEEVFTILTACGYQTHWACAKEYIDVFYSKLIPSTARHTSSTLQDLKAKKPTEIEALNGAVLALARQYHKKAPANENVYHMLKTLEDDKEVS